MTLCRDPLPYARAPGLDAPEPRHPVIVVGAGPVGLAAALDLARRDVPVVLLDDNDVVSEGSRAICWSKRSLEILDRLGVGERCREAGVTWKLGRTFHRDEELFSFDLLPEDGHKMSAFVNLQQYRLETALIEAVLATGRVDLRVRNRVRGLVPMADGVRLTVQTPDGAYSLEADWLVACDGARSPIRGMLGLDFEGRAFEERFLITDIEMTADFPPERWFWFEPPFHAGQSALLHKQPDDIWRIDLQLGPDADPDEERRPERIVPRIERMLGHGDFRIVWSSVYSFQCRRLARFVHGRVIFAGDSAHVVSPFGARGGNGGLQDVDALGWRLAAVIRGASPPAVLDRYEVERVRAADENIMHSARATRFMSPAPGAERRYRDAVLGLARTAPFARAMVNSGRLSRPCRYDGDGPDAPGLPARARPGVVAPDAPLGNGWLLEALGGEMTMLALAMAPPEGTGLRTVAPEVTPVIAERYLGTAASALYLIRPDQVIAGRWLTADAAAIRALAGAIREGWR